MSQAGQRQDLGVRAFAHSRRPATSQVLQDLADGLSAGRVTMTDLVTALDGRAFGFLLLLDCIALLVPNLPGSSTVFGVVMLLLSVHLLLGRARLWLPSWIGRRSASSGTVRRMIALSLPTLRWLERLVRPRLSVITYPPFESFVGGVVLLLGVLVTLPIPLGNWLPGVAGVLVALGLLERDGLVLIVGLITGVASFALVALIVIGVVNGTALVLQ